MTMCKMSPINLFLNFFLKIHDHNHQWRIQVLWYGEGAMGRCSGRVHPPWRRKRRVCLGAFRTSLVASLHVKADELPLNYDVNNCVYNISVNFDKIHAILLSMVYFVLASDACLRLGKLLHYYMTIYYYMTIILQVTLPDLTQYSQYCFMLWLSQIMVAITSEFYSNCTQHQKWH